MNWLNNINVIGEVFMTFGVELSVALFFVAAALSCRRARSSLRRQRQLEFDVQQLTVCNNELLQDSVTLRQGLQSLEARLDALYRQQETMRLRSDKADLKVARSLAENGASVQQLRDCGLSIGEAHLVSALHRRGSRPAADRAPVVHLHD